MEKAANEENGIIEWLGHTIYLVKCASTNSSKIEPSELTEELCQFFPEVTQQNAYLILYYNECKITIVHSDYGDFTIKNFESDPVVHDPFLLRRKSTSAKKSVVSAVTNHIDRILDRLSSADKVIINNDDRNLMLLVMAEFQNPAALLLKQNFNENGTLKANQTNIALNALVFDEGIQIDITGIKKLIIFLKEHPKITALTSRSHLGLNEQAEQKFKEFLIETTYFTFLGIKSHKNNELYQKIVNRNWHLKHFETIEPSTASLSFKNSYFTEQQFADLLVKLNKFSELKCLSFYYTALSNTQQNMLCEFLQQQPKISEVVLEDVSIDTELWCLLATPERFETITLNNEKSNLAFKRFCNAANIIIELKQKAENENSIEKLSFADADFTREQFSTLLELLSSFTKVNSLMFSNITIPKQMKCELENFISSNFTIIELQAKNNNRANTANFYPENIPIMGNIGGSSIDRNKLLHKCETQNVNDDKKLVFCSIINSMFLERLFKSLQERRNIHLIFDHAKFTDNAIATLAELMVENHTIESLEISQKDFIPSVTQGSEFKSEDIAILAGSLKNNSYLTSLSLNYIDIGDIGGEAIADLLQSKQSALAHLSCICIQHSKPTIGKKGIKAICSALANNEKLISVKIDGQHIGEAIGILGDALAKNKTLLSFSLTHSDINHQAALTIIKKICPDITSKGKKAKTLPARLTTFTIEHHGRNTNTQAEKDEKTKDQLFQKYRKAAEEKKSEVMAYIENNDLTSLQKDKDYYSPYLTSKDDGNTLLHLAIEKGSLKLVTFFCEQHYNLRLRNDKQQTPLELAVSLYGEDNQITKKLRQTMSSNQTDKKRKIIDTADRDEEILAKKSKTPEQQAVLSEVPVLTITKNEPSISEPLLLQSSPALQESIQEPSDFFNLIADWDSFVLRRGTLVAYQQAWDWIKAGVTTATIFYDNEFLIESFTLLHKTIAKSQISLVKILLHAADCPINQHDGNGDNVLDWAIKRSNKSLLARLLANPRLDSSLMEETLKKLSRLPNPQAIIYRELLFIHLQQKSQRHLETGVNWVRQFSLLYNSSKPNKRVVLNLDEHHASLALNNQLNQQRLQATGKSEIDETDGNPVTASITFIISVKHYLSGAPAYRTAVTVHLDTLKAIKINDNFGNELSFNNALRHRIQSADVMASQKFRSPNDEAPLKVNEFDELLRQDNDEEGTRMLFNLKFHHGEQTLLTFLEDKVSIKAIVAKFSQTSGFVPQCKILALVLNIHSPRDICENCAFAVLGAQNSQDSPFLQQLKQELELIGCIFPAFRPLRMLTQVSSYQSHTMKNASTQKEAMDLYEFDLRGLYNNEFILSKDLLATTSLTQFHSRR